MLDLLTSCTPLDGWRRGVQLQGVLMLYWRSSLEVDQEEHRCLSASSSSRTRLAVPALVPDRQLQGALCLWNLREEILRADLLEVDRQLRAP